MAKNLLESKESKLMANSKTYGMVPQMGMVNKPKSHASTEVSLTDSGGGKKSPKSKGQFTLFVATYNIRTMKDTEKLTELEEELKNIKWDILGLCETRMPDEKCTTLKSGHLLYQNNSQQDSHIGGTALMIHKKWKHAVTRMKSISSRVMYIVIKLSKRYSIQITQVYAPTSKSDDGEIEQMYEEISLAQAAEKTHYKIIMGDFNAKMGDSNKDGVKNRGNFGLGNVNERGEMLLNFLQESELYCMNTFFRKPKQKRWTWKSPDSTTKNEIDYILTNKKGIVQDVSVLNQFSVGSDHRLLRAKVKINHILERQKLIRSQGYPSILEIQQNIERYQQEIKKNIPSINIIKKLEVDELENKLRESITTAVKCIGPTNKQNGKITKETKDLLERRRKLDKTNQEYEELNKKVKKEIRKDTRKYNARMIEEVIENNKNMKIIKNLKTIGRSRIYQLKNKEGEIKTEKEEIIKITENFYGKLYETTISKPEEEYSRVISNVGSEILPEITTAEIENALYQMKNGRAPGTDGITCEMIKMGGSTIIEAVRILLNKCLTTGIIPETWYDAQMILLHKKGDTLNINNYRPISLLPHPYKLLTKIITTRLTNKFDNYQPVEQAGFRKGYSTIEHIQSLRLLIEKCTEYNIPIHLAFIDYNKAFDSIELWAIYKAMNNARIDSRYRILLKNIYDHATFHIKITEDTITRKLPMKRGVRQGDTISPKLFTLALEEIFKQINWEGKGINVDGRFLTHLRYADDIVIISTNLEELQEMVRDLKSKSEMVGLTMNLEKTKIMTLEERNIYIEDQMIPKVQDYIYLGHEIQLGKNNQTAEISRRIRLTWAAVGKLNIVINNKDTPINLKRKVFNTCILPVMTYGMETVSLTVKSANRLRRTQRAIERKMLKISLRDHIRNEDIRQKTKVDDVISSISKLKWSWAGHVARQDNERWTKQLMQWRPRQNRRSVGRPQQRWTDDIKKKAGNKWYQVAQNREDWQKKGEAYVQEWMEKG